jgi:hypothetical protein
MNAPATHTGLPTSENDAILAELAVLERDEHHLSAVRRRLHAQIDLGYPNELALVRERKVSAERRELHARIDALRARLN